LQNQNNYKTKLKLRERRFKEAHLMYKNSIVLAIAILSFVSISSPAFSDEPNYVAGEVLVRFKPKDNEAERNTQERNEILASLGGGSIVKTFKLVPGLSLVKLPQGVSVNAALTNFSNAAEIVHVQPNYIHRAILAFPNEPRFNELVGLHNTGQNGGTPDADIDAPQAWEITTESSIVVAVIDSGIDYTHPDLAANMWHNPGEIPGNSIDDEGNGYIDDIYGYDFHNDDNDPMDDFWHGTHCAGTIGAVGNNGQGIAGVCWNVKIMALKYLDSGGHSGSTADEIECFDYAVMNGAKILSCSWGGSGYDQFEKNAIEAAGANGVLLIAGAGNDGTNNDTDPNYPASHDSNNIIAVMSSDEGDKRSIFSPLGTQSSNFGPNSVDLAAPGSDILSCDRGGAYKSWSGTSMATPHVSGACALVWAVNPELTHLQVKDVILSTVDTNPNFLCVTGGRLNLYKALIESANRGSRVGVSDNVNNGSSVSPGNEITYRIWFQTGLSGVNIIDYLPDEVNYPTVSDPNYDMLSHTYTWTPGPNEPNWLEITVVVNATAEPNGTINNVCVIEAGGIQPATAVEVTDVNCWGSDIIYVDKDANGLRIGTSWQNAYPDIHSALARAGSGCGSKIWVTGGRYCGVLPRYIRLQLKTPLYKLSDGVELYGGFNGSESTLSQRQLGDPNNETLLDGDPSNDGYADVNYVVFSIGGSQKTIVDGFTIREGQMAGVDVNDSWVAIYNCLIRDNEYRGVWCETGSSVEIVNCEIKNNNGESLGTGIYCIGTSTSRSSITVQDSNIHGHLYDGIYCITYADPCVSRSAVWDNNRYGIYSYYYCDTDIRNSIVKGNGRQGIYVDTCDAYITSCVVSDNSRDGVYCKGRIPVITNNVIHHNAITSGNYYGLYLYNPLAGAVVRGNTVVYNQKPGIRLDGTNKPTITNCIVWGNEGSELYSDQYQVRYSCVENGYSGTGNISADPCFVNADVNDYHINENSPCIDKGNSSVVQPNETDIDGKKRLLDGDGNDTVIVDLGADEYYWSPADFNENGDVNFIDFAILAAAWKSIYGNTNYNEECDLEDDNVIDFKDIRLFCEDWLWDKDTAQGYMMGMGGGGDSGFGGEGMEFSQETFGLEGTETSFEADPQPSPEMDPNVIEEMLKWLDEMWNSGVFKEVMTEEEYLEFRKLVIESGNY
jgi:parallel beta-helix repeat protein